MKHIVFAALLSALLFLAPSAFAELRSNANSGASMPATTAPVTRAQVQGQGIVCPLGQIKNKFGQCVTPGTSGNIPVATPVECPQGQHMTKVGTCKQNDEVPVATPVECPQGQHLTKAGTCKQNDEVPVATPACGLGQTVGLMGFCASEPQANGKCKLPLKKASDGKCYSKEDAAAIKKG